MRCMNSYTLNKNVFSLFLNVVSVMSGARSAAGRLFHTRGPWTAKSGEFLGVNHLDHVHSIQLLTNAAYRCTYQQRCDCD